MFYSFHYTSLLLPWLSLIPKYFILFVTTVNGIVSLISFSDCSLLVYRNATDFCVLTLDPTTLLNSFISSTVLLWNP